MIRRIESLSGGPRRALLTCFLALALAGASPSCVASLPVPVAEALAAAGIPAASVGVVVQEVRAGKARLAVNSGTAMNPASVMKLVTTYAALELLGPAYTWRTEALATGKVRDGVMSGDLYLRGRGDPRLTLEQFWLLLRQVRARGVTEIRGDLVLDRGYFAPVEHDPGRFDGEALRPYNTGPDALLLNFNSLRLTFLPPAEKAGLKVLAEPHPAQLEIVNLLEPSSGACADVGDHVRTDFSSAGARPRLILTGRYPTACGERTLNVSVMDHPQYVFGVFAQLWSELGGRLGGAVRSAATPEDATPMASVESPPLAAIVRDINKWSNNVMARQVLITLGAERSGKPGGPSEGAAAIRAWLAAKGAALPELVLENGSGLSRVERISPGHLAGLLVDAFRSPVMPEFLASLPVSATDGTMRKRLKNRPAAGRARIKTGTLEGVKSIAGYVQDRRGAWVAVVFIVNHPNAGAAQAAQDALIEWVYEANGT